MTRTEVKKLSFQNFYRTYIGICGFEVFKKPQEKKLSDSNSLCYDCLFFEFQNRIIDLVIIERLLLYFA